MRIEVLLHAFLILGRDEWSASTASHFNPRAIALDLHQEEAE
jgi:hypothetical protein